MKFTMKHLLKLEILLLIKKIYSNKTTDSLDYLAANVIIGTLETDNPGQTFLLNSEVLAKANNSTIAKLFNKFMHILLYLSDAALIGKNMEM